MSSKRSANRSKSIANNQDLNLGTGSSSESTARKGESMLEPEAQVEGRNASSRAMFVTRPAEITKLEEWKILLHGVDSLDVGLYIKWDGRWPRVRNILESGKRRASGTEGLRLGDGRCLIRPTGKRPRYRWHLQYPGFHLFLSKDPFPVKQTPNGYVSINSQTLWSLGIREALEVVESEIRTLGGDVREHRISRCDPCLDLLIPGGLTLDFLQRHRVPSHRKESHFQTGDVLETYYNGRNGGDVQVRIYDKATEVLLKESKLWFVDLWQVPVCRDVWRIEYQLRRTVLKEFGINTLDDLDEKLPGLWQYLTCDWFSLRLPDDANATRRTVHPMWSEVQQSAERFGSVVELKRRAVVGEVDVKRYVSQMGGYLVGFAARKGIETLDEVLRDMEAELRSYFESKDFEERIRIKSIQQGRLLGKDAA